LRENLAEVAEDSMLANRGIAKWRVLQCGVMLLAAAANAARADDPPPDEAAVEARVARMIEQLGAEDFAVREKAQSDLATLGLAAFDALHAAQNHNDPEIALRSRYLVRSMSVRWFEESDSRGACDKIRVLKFGHFTLNFLLPRIGRDRYNI
jgi:hypothetical protein